MKTNLLSSKKITIILLSVAIGLSFTFFSNIAYANEKTTNARLNVLVLCGVSDLNSQANRVGTLFASNHLAQETNARISQYDSHSNPATVTDINNALNAAFSGAKEGDMNVLYYMGHGTVSYNGNKIINALKGYGGMCDADPSNGLNLSDGNKTSFATYSYFDLSEQLLKYNGHFILILDCCGSGGFITYGFRSSINETYTSVVKTTKFTVLTSAADNKDAPMGLDGSFLQYTDILLKDACGYPSFNSMKADNNGDGILTPYELHSYMASSLLYRAQNVVSTKPQIKSSNGDAPFYLIKPGTLKMNETAVEIDINKQKSMSVTLDHAGGSKTGVKWKSSDTAIVGVGTTGLTTTIYGKKPGSATITAYLVDGKGYVCKNTEVRCTVTVRPSNIKDAQISLSKTSYTYSGKSIKPTIKVVLDGKTLTNGTDYTVSYLNNKNMGKATVTVSGKGNYTGSISKQFTIKPVIKLSAKKATINIRKKKTKQLKVTVKCGTKAPKVKWKSSKPSVVKVSSKGKLTAKKAGKATITASIKTSVGTFNAKCKVTVVKKYTIEELKKIANKKVKKKYGNKYVASEFSVYSKYLRFFIRYQGGNTANILVGSGEIKRSNAKVIFRK